MNKTIEYHEKETGHPTKQIGIVVGCTKCDYTLYTLRNTEHVGKNLDGNNDFLSKMMKNLSPEEKAWENRPIRIRMQKAKKKAEQDRIRGLTRQILNATEAEYPCKVRGSYSKQCEVSFVSKKALRTHLIRSHTEGELDSTIKYYLGE